MRTVTPPARTVARSTWIGGSVALVLLVLVIVMLGDTRVFSGSDAGGKAATVTRLADVGTGGADIGYWAEAADPDGVLHPVVKTERRSDGWVQVTSSAMPILSSWGERLAGSVGALWLAIVSVPIGALGAARLARGMGAPTGFTAFIVIGAASPLTFYGADQWEHAPALAAGLWAVALLRERLVGWEFVALGVAAGTAGALRREVVLVLLVLGVLELLQADRRRFWFSHLGGAVVAGAAAVSVLAGVYVLDGAVLGESLASRSAAQAGLAGSDGGQRLHDAVLTTVSQYSNLSLPYSLIGLLTLVGVALATFGWVRDDESRVRMGAMLVGASLVVRILVGGFTFVPGAFAALPVAAAAPFLARGRERLLVAGSVAAMGVVIMLQWTGSLGAQWGGRYLLVPAAVVAVVALAEIERRDLRHPGAIVGLGATVAIALLGLVWHVERADLVAESRDAVLEVTEGEILISTHPHFPREIGPAINEERWLLGPTPEAVTDAFAVAAELTTGERVWLLHPGNACDDDPCGRTWGERRDADPVVGWRSVQLVEVPWLVGDTFVLEAFEPA